MKLLYVPFESISSCVQFYSSNSCVLLYNYLSGNLSTTLCHCTSQHFKVHIKSTSKNEKPSPICLKKCISCNNYCRREKSIPKVC